MPGLTYHNYSLSRLLTVRDIVSFDRVIGDTHTRSLHFHADAWELIYCKSGSVTVCKDGQENHLNPGQILMVQPGVQHDSQQHAGETLFISFTCPEDKYLSMLGSTVFRVSANEGMLLNRALEEVQEAFQTSNNQVRIHEFKPNADSPLGSEHMLCAYLEQTLICLLRHATKKGGRPVRHGQFKQAMEQYLIDNVYAYIRDHLAETLSLGQIARYFHYSKSRLSALFKGCAGISLSQAISAERLKQAQKLLAESDATVAEIAERVGFSSPQYFSRRFHQHLGIPPVQYLREHRIQGKRTAEEISQADPR